MSNLSPKQFQLFDTKPYTAAENYDPEKWISNPSTVWHGSSSSTMPSDKGAKPQGRPNNSSDTGRVRGQDGSGFHTGTYQAAYEAAASQADYGDKYIHPLRIGGEHTEAPWSDTRANSSDGHEAVVQGRNVPYVNDAEDKGSISYRSPRKNLHTWKQSVLTDPNSPTAYRRVAETGLDPHVAKSQVDFEMEQTQGVEHATEAKRKHQSQFLGIQDSLPLDNETNSAPRQYLRRYPPDTPYKWTK